MDFNIHDNKDYVLAYLAGHRCISLCALTYLCMNIPGDIFLCKYCNNGYNFHVHHVLNNMQTALYALSNLYNTIKYSILILQMKITGLHKLGYQSIPYNLISGIGRFKQFWAGGGGIVVSIPAFQTVPSDPRACTLNHTTTKTT